MGRKSIHKQELYSKEYYRSHNLKKCYGITLHEFEKMFDKQGRRCAICRGILCHGKNWHVDHDHKTKEIRGILCGWCNTALGKFQENPNILEMAKLYITRYKMKGQGKDIEKAIHYLQILLERISDAELERINAKEP